MKTSKQLWDEQQRVLLEALAEHVTENKPFPVKQTFRTVLLWQQYARTFVCVPRMPQWLYSLEQHARKSTTDKDRIVRIFKDYGIVQATIALRSLTGNTLHECRDTILHWVDNK